MLQMLPAAERTTAKTTMDLPRIEALALRLMVQHGLGHWAFGFDRARTRLGSCQYIRNVLTGATRDHKITLTRYIASAPTWQIRDTILHEIAHAIDVERRGTSDHGPTWKAICREIGADPSRTADCEIEAPAKWTLRCTKCGHERKVARLSRAAQTGRRWFNHGEGCGGKREVIQNY
jgi:predicted SprT family Zn-dependent metalloprotease